MTRRDFELIARNLKDTLDLEVGDPMTVKLIAHGLAAALVATNPRFDRERFLVACGVAS